MKSCDSEEIYENVCVKSEVVLLGNRSQDDPKKKIQMERACKLADVAAAQMWNAAFFPGVAIVAAFIAIISTLFEIDAKEYGVVYGVIFVVISILIFRDMSENKCKIKKWTIEIHALNDLLEEYKEIHKKNKKELLPSENPLHLVPDKTNQNDSPLDSVCGTQQPQKTDSK